MTGVYREHIAIDKTLSLVGIGGPVIDGEGKGTVVEINAPGCTVSGFTIRGTGESLTIEDSGISLNSAKGSVIENNHLYDILFGIYLKNSPDSIIKGNTLVGKDDLSIPNRGDGIRLWYSSNTKVLDNDIRNTRDLVIWFSSGTLIRGNSVRGGRYGLHYMYSNRNTFEDNLFEGNYVGGFLMYSKGLRFYHNVFSGNQSIASGYGIGFKDIDDVEAADNVFIDNRIGIYLDNSPSLIDSWNRITDNLIAYNDVGISLMPSIERNVFLGNSFVENTEQVGIRGGGTLSGNKWFGADGGNYWSDYVGFDKDEDGYGDVPYVAESLFESLIDKYPALRLFMFSPVVNAIEFAAEAFPVVKPKPKVVDRMPLMRPLLPPRFRPQERVSSAGLLLASTVLLALSLGFYSYILVSGKEKR